VFVSIGIVASSLNDRRADVKHHTEMSVFIASPEAVTKSPLSREWFFEQRDGTCRLMPDLASRIGESAVKWRTEVAPIAEWFAEAVCSVSPNAESFAGPQSRLTRQRWKESMRREDKPSKIDKELRLQNVCATCGAAISTRNEHCKACAVAVSTAALIEGARAGRIAAVTPEAMERRREAGKRQNEAVLHEPDTTKAARIDAAQNCGRTFNINRLRG
jgi:hypothetical protein